MATREIPEYDTLIESLNTVIRSTKSDPSDLIEQISHIVPTLPVYLMTREFVARLIQLRDRCANDPIQQAHITCAILRHPIGETLITSLVH